MTTPELTPDQAKTVLRQQILAQSTLTGYARYIDIPGVPDDEDVDDRQYRVVETPLAVHHIFMLNILQLMVQGLLFYNQQMEGLIGYRVMRGEAPETEEETIIAGVLSGRISSLDALSLLGKIPGFSQCKRVMIMLPPGSAKSTYASVVFPTWVMGQTKAFEVILTGWGDPICRRHGKRARQICASPQFNALFGTGLDPNTRAAEDWSLKNNSSYKSSGIQSGVAGFRTHGLVWDDLTKNRKEADSQTIRDDVYNAYIDDARSRKTPTAWEVGIGTRWHEDEIMGRILPEGYNGESGFMECRDGNVWYVICMAAECEVDDDPLGREKGEMIWPEWFDEGYWAEKRRVPRSWGSLYQQRPAPEEGIVFKLSLIHISEPTRPSP